jgi:glycosyltransferase involved in cell wall biosynthesis
MSRGYRVLPVKTDDGEVWLETQLRERGLTPEVLPVRHGYDLKYLKELTELLKRRNVDLVHSHEFTKAVYGGAATKKLGLPHVISMHGSQTMTRKLRRRMALRWAFRNARATVAVSEDTRRHLEESLGLPQGRVVTIPNGIPVRTGDPDPVRRELGIRDEDVVILCVGNLLERKGHIVILDALRMLDQEGCEVPWKLIIAGRGEQHDRLREFSREHGLEDRVRLVGHRDDIPSLQSAAHIFSMPSLWEGLPLAVLEAMFAGNAVVASATSGIPEAIDDGVNGILVPPGDSGALAGALRRLLESSTLRQGLGKAARAKADAEFTIARMTDRYEALYWRNGRASRA